MSFETAKQYLTERGFGDRVQEFDTSSATVALAAQALGCAEGRIAKSLSFLTKDGPIVILAAGDIRVDNRKYKDTFHMKATMLPREETEALLGHAAGGVCPFGLKEGVKVYLDVSLKQYDIVYPACGSSNSAVRLTVEELEQLARPESWVDIAKEA